MAPPTDTDTEAAPTGWGRLPADARRAPGRAGPPLSLIDPPATGGLQTTTVRRTIHEARARAGGAVGDEATMVEPDRREMPPPGAPVEPVAATGTTTTRAALDSRDPGRRRRGPARHRRRPPPDHPLLPSEQLVDVDRYGKLFFPDVPVRWDTDAYRRLLAEPVDSAHH